MPRRPYHRLVRKLHRLIIVVACLASIATSKRYTKTAALEPSLQLGGGDLALRVDVEASAQPQVSCGAHVVHPLAATTWPGRASFLCPPHTTLRSVQLSSLNRKLPKDAYVRVVATQAVSPWLMTARSAPIAVVLEAKRGARYWVRMIATTPPELEASTVGLPTPLVSQYMVSFEAGAAARGTLQLSARMVGACPDATPCQPPPDARLEFVSVAPEAAP